MDRMGAFLPVGGVYLTGEAAWRVLAALRLAERAARGDGLCLDLGELVEILRPAAEAYEHRAGRAAARVAGSSRATERDELRDTATPAPEWISTTTAGRIFGLDPSYWRRLATRGAVEARWSGRGWELRAESAKAWAAERRTTPAA